MLTRTTIEFEGHAWVGKDRYDVEIYVSEFKPCPGECTQTGADLVRERFNLYPLESFREDIHQINDKNLQVLFRGTLTAEYVNGCGETTDTLLIRLIDYAYCPGLMPWELGKE